MTGFHYILNEQHEPVDEPDFTKWADWMSTHCRTVALDQVKKDVMVSTVFTGLNSNIMSDKPHLLLWETMVFGGRHDKHKEHYASHVDALAGHARIVEMVKH
jgi:hypothetical protein